MKILWLINSPLPEALSIISGKHSERTGSGGWQVALADDISKTPGLELFVAASFSCSEVKYIKGRNITHILVPSFSADKQVLYQAEYWKQIKNRINPDVIHIHGTEYLHGVSFIRACGSQNVIVSLQGMISVISRYYRLGISDNEIIRNLTPYDIVRHQSIFDQERTFVRKGKIENDVISSVYHIIGRTSWDRDHSLSINPKVKYHFCNESLREAFYEGKWEYNNCTTHSIFLSQASYPVKGLHLFLKALRMVKANYSDVSVRIAGPDFIHPKTTKEKLKFGGYAKLIRRIISRSSLDKVITFTGPLNAEQMKREYLNANVFVCPSTIENSPNSLGEAQILGVPCVASYVGGIPDFIPNINCGRLYRFEEYEMLSSIICDIFENSINFNNSEMRALAMSRHSREGNAKRTVEIYKDIVKG